MRLYFITTVNAPVTSAYNSFLLVDEYTLRLVVWDRLRWAGDSGHFVKENVWEIWLAAYTTDTSSYAQCRRNFLMIQPQCVMSVREIWLVQSAQNTDCAGVLHVNRSTRNTDYRQGHNPLIQSLHSTTSLGHRPMGRWFSSIVTQNVLKTISYHGLESQSHRNTVHVRAIWEFWLTT